MAGGPIRPKRAIRIRKAMGMLIGCRRVQWYSLIGWSPTYAALTPGNSVMKNLVAACVLAALIIMGLLAFAQHHEECWHGHSIKTFKPCGSLSSSI